MIEQTGGKALDALLTQGVLGVLCVLLILALVVAGLVIRSLHNDIKGLHKEARDDREKLITAIEASTDATESTETALQGIRATLDSRHQTVADLAQRVELIARDAQHGLRNISQALAGVARLVDRRGDRHRAPPADHDDTDWGPP